MEQDELITNVKAKLPTRMAVTVNWVQARYHVTQGAARKCIETLKAEGLIGSDWSMELGGFPVIVQEGEQA